jgi:hypothetical protein
LLAYYIYFFHYSKLPKEKSGEEIGQVMQVEIVVQSNQWCKKEAGKFYEFNSEYQLCTSPKGLVPSDADDPYENFS